MRRSCLFTICALVAGLTCALSNTAKAAQGDKCNVKFMDAEGNLRPETEKAFLMHQAFDVYQKADTNCDGHLSPDEVKAFENSQPVMSMLQLGEDYINRSVAAGQPIHLDKNGDPLVPIVAPTTPSPPSCGPGWQFLLRGTAEDIGVFACPKDFKTASGAQFSYSWDGVADNTSWAAQGIATVVYNWQNMAGPATAGSPYVAGFAIAPWMSFNRLTESAASLAKMQVDVLSFGGTGEVAFANVLDAAQYLRAKPAYNTDFEGHPHSWSQTLEWQPVSNDLGISVPNPLGSMLTYEIDPILRYQYSQAIAKSTDPIFASGNSVSRVGPVLALTIAPLQNDIIVPHWLQAASFTASYEWLSNVYRTKNYRLLNTALNLPIDSQGHLAMKVSYQDGQIEETAQNVQKVMVGISAKW
jgi:hypothetical protein